MGGPGSVSLRRLQPSSWVGAGAAARLGLRTPFSPVPLRGCGWQASLWPAQRCLSSRWLCLVQQVVPESRQEPPVLYDPPGKAHSHHSVLSPHAPITRSTSPCPAHTHGDGNEAGF